MRIKFLVEKSGNQYSIMSETDVDGCYFGGYGESVKEAKEDCKVCIQEMYEDLCNQGLTPSFTPSDIVMECRYDLPAFFNDFEWINVSAFAKFAGINESKMRAYKNGLSSASEKTANKIMKAVETLASALSTAQIR